MELVCGGPGIMLYYTTFKIMPQNQNSEVNLAYILESWCLYYFCLWEFRMNYSSRNRSRFVMTLIKFEHQDLFILPYIKSPELGILSQKTQLILILLYFRTPTCSFSMLSYVDTIIYSASLWPCVLEDSVQPWEKKISNVVTTMDSLLQNSSSHLYSSGSQTWAF